MIDRTTRHRRRTTSTRLIAAGVAALLLAGCQREPDEAEAPASAADAAPSATTAYFDWFAYTGRDAAFEAPVPEGSFRNPVLSGFYSDPSVTAANGKFYLVSSTFTFFPGIPVMESEDLVHWKQVGNAIHRPEQLDFDGLGVSRGVFAPAIEFHDGTFYVVNTSVDAGGNFIVTATDPAGPWSDPAWLPGIGGIDPSLFFDDDGKVYILNNDEPEVPVRYDGHRAIWLQEIDIATKKPFGPRKVLIDGGVKPEDNPIWIEGPHIYKVDGWYYLNNAEGGTGPQHSQVILRSRDVWGPYEPYEHNPILTQRDLDPNRPLPVTNAGHADLVQGPDGSWWATFLASRNYGVDHYNTGREAFLLPVTWKDGWPVILPRGEEIPYVLPGPSFMKSPADQAPMTSNFTWRDEFDTVELGKGWMTPRVPKTQWYDGSSRPGWLAIHPLRERLDTKVNPSFYARRQQHQVFEASTAMEVPAEGVAAGLAAFQGDTHWYFLGVRRAGEGVEVFLEKKAGEGEAEIVARDSAAAATQLTLHIEGNEGRYGFGFDAGDGAGVQWLTQDADGTILSTDIAGGFVGATIGPYARDERAP
ncbi:glycoside hydrolase family 43 protein [Luteimonas kalidii]|uniref:Glycoside hydrolase family 43 protein n=1 Tax=Luteimonas kalidii TaxID=3042025 RepID=A0ABT6JQN4_9GAMM|nr:glycoside hydrolase family 43 protein [Luteimonas kalidii]MDH5832919.1 glycoside hydrolase family 43 protein [Luteimonas kalidii]